MSDAKDEYAKSVNEKAIDSSNMVLKTLILIHGGSAVALLAFIGNLSGKTSPILGGKIGSLATTIIWFGWGVAITVAAMTCAYFTNYLTVGHAFADIEETKKRYAFWKAAFHIPAVLLTLSSLCLFLFGMYQVRDAISAALR
ncbi:hypothetical protein GCM10009087_41140 [Sphingomonas oligophenolica]|uniref:DUF1206 domain-containing protein n=1 Tax=Sphingomonas oligophenolica TaxID=301154 RepID=A0ABU9YCV3_9SPHN